MIPYDILQMTQNALADRTDLEEWGQTLLLAVRITPTTPRATRCPSCWDDTRKQTTVPNDPTCLGVGWVVGTQGGYLVPVPLPDAFVNANQDMSTFTPQGVMQSSQDVLYVSPTARLLPKKGDVLIQTGPTLTHSRRSVVADQANPKTLGSAILYETFTLEYRRPDNIIYLISLADKTGLGPGTWT